jgi:hypothetical protein
MRFVMLMQPNTTAEAWEEGPDVESVAAMGEFNQALVDAGVLKAADGFHPPAAGARVTRSGDQPTVGDVALVPGQTVGGYWIIDVASRDEAVEWALRCPLNEGDSIELRRVYEMSDHPEDVQEAAQLSETPPEQTAAS